MLATTTSAPLRRSPPYSAWPGKGGQAEPKRTSTAFTASPRLCSPPPGIRVFPLRTRSSGAAPLAPLRGYPCTLAGKVHPLRVCIFPARLKPNTVTLDRLPDTLQLALHYLLQHIPEHLFHSLHDLGGAVEFLATYAFSIFFGVCSICILSFNQVFSPPARPSPSGMRSLPMLRLPPPSLN